MKKDGLSMEILESAAEALEKWETGKLTLDECADDLRQNRREAHSAAASILFNLFRHKAQIEWLLLRSASKVKPGVMRILSAAAAQMLCQTGVASESAANIAVELAKRRCGPQVGNFVNAMLRKLPDVKELEAALAPAPDCVKLNIPANVHKRWKKFFGPEKVREIAECLKEQAPMTLRLLKGAEPDETLRKLGAKLPPFDWAPEEAFYEVKDPAKIFESALFQNGLIYIQDPSTAMAVSLASLTGKKKLLDLCAAPGGKSVLLSEKMDKDAALVSADASERRLQRLKENFKRMKISARIANAEEFSAEKDRFDFILADVPCSGTGSLRRRPDTLWRVSGRSSAELGGIQGKILEKAAALLAPGGALVYSTCSIEPEENSERVKLFLGKHPEFALEKESLIFPSKHNDGAFAALLKKSL